MAYKGRAKGNIIILENGISLPDGIEVEVIPTRQQSEASVEELRARTILGAKMRAFAERIAERKINLSDLIVQARPALDERA